MQTQENVKKGREGRSAMALIALCWLVYSCSYIGKINYSANIIRIQEFFSIENYSEVGLVSTLFFFSYGIGQVVNGIWCKKYNLKWIIFFALMLSGTINLIIPLLPIFEPYKYLWTVNGFTLAILWPSLIRLLSEALPRKYMAKASVIMGTTVAVGTFFVYGTSALFAKFTNFKAAFYTAAIVLIGVAIVWIAFISRLVDAQQREDEDEKKAVGKNAGADAGKSGKRVIYFSICVLAFCGILTNLIKDGLGTWVPSILKDNYELDDSLSIILALALPVVAIFGNALAVSVHKRMGDFVYQCALMFAISGAFIAVVIASFSLDGWWLLLVCFTLVTLLISSCNSLITSIFPLFMRGKLNSGLIAGVLNGFSYVGSTLSTYGLALIADKSGWMAVFWTLFWCCVAVVCAAVIYLIVRKFVLHAGAKEPREQD